MSLVIFIRFLLLRLCGFDLLIYNNGFLHSISGLCTPPAPFPPSLPFSNTMAEVVKVVEEVTAESKNLMTKVSSLNKDESLVQRELLNPLKFSLKAVALFFAMNYFFCVCPNFKQNFTMSRILLYCGEWFGPSKRDFCLLLFGL